MKKNNPNPNFFIIGAPKCGTSSLAGWLAEHPHIYMSPIKEPFFFSSDLGGRIISDWDDYLGLFSGADVECTAVGEASTTYLFSNIAVPTIEKALPNSRYIVMIRNPLEMAYALHEQQIRVDKENIVDFYQAWLLSPERRNGRKNSPGPNDPIFLDYQSWCLLGEQLMRLYKLVPKERILVLTLDDVKQNPRREYLKTLKFLDIPDDGRLSFPVRNSSREWRNPLFMKFVRGFGFWIVWAKYVAHILPKRGFGIMQFFEDLFTRQRSRPELLPVIRRELEDYYFEDIKLLERLLGRSFQSWVSHGNNM